ncbi:MAG: hypothetical protein HY507_01120 [Candidatus Zambryskibacteria bacterium]|nr:hypothetical protein [Candidatus Zambryskibacteria bacterium]
MQIVSHKGNIVEKILRDKQGRLVRARFYVYESGERIKARLVDFVYLDEKDSNNTEKFSLPGYKKEDKYFYEIFEKSQTSPFTTLESLYFLGSKPRAPTF